MPDHLRIVSSKSQADLARTKSDLAREQALNQLSYSLREFVANILRVTRGAGKAHEIPHQMTRLLELYDAFFAAAKRYPVEQEIQDILDPGREIRPSLSREADEWEGGIDDMIKGALQMAASRMLSQGTQESAGERQLIRGLRVIEAIREHNRKTVAASVRPGTLAKPNRKAPTKPTNRKPSRT